MENQNQDQKTQAELLSEIEIKLKDEATTDTDRVGLLNHKIQLMEGQQQAQGDGERSSVELIRDGLKTLQQRGK